MRKIDADAAIDRMKEIYCKSCDNDYGCRCEACWLDNAIGEIEETPTLRDWIPCSDRKPDDDSYNWAVGITSSGRCIAFQEHNAYENDTGGISVPTYLAHGSEITHWMPLPEVPQRKDDAR